MFVEQTRLHCFQLLGLSQLVERNAEKHERHAAPLRLTTPHQTHLPRIDLVPHEQHGEKDAEELACGGDGGEHQRREVPHRVQNEHLSHGAAHTEQDSVLSIILILYCDAQTHAILQQEGKTGLELLKEERRDERHQNTVDIQHFLQPERRRLETGDHNILLHATDAVHAEGEHEEDETEVAVGLRADLLVGARELENWGLVGARGGTDNAGGDDQNADVLLNGVLAR